MIEKYSFIFGDHGSQDDQDYVDVVNNKTPISYPLYVIYLKTKKNLNLN